MGLVQRSTALNTVAARATAIVDVRFPTLNIMEKILGEVREICRCCEMRGSEGRILREGNFLPLEQDERAVNSSMPTAARPTILVSGWQPRGRAAQPTAASLRHSEPRPCAGRPGSGPSQ